MAIYFDYNDYNINETQKKIDEFILHNIFEGKLIRLEGHCAEIGTLEYNLALGKDRANAVKEYLISKFDKDVKNRYSVISYGEERLISTGSVSESWKMNRRVEIIIEDMP